MKTYYTQRNHHAWNHLATWWHTHENGKFIVFIEIEHFKMPMLAAVTDDFGNLVEVPR